ncbi:hypothetical protein B0H17DRAFT_1213914 [Mycena rosella]|uniref:Uncharacterized protein n=1 Tax=Mycena rosella TaxID=1033263 RepID=A0AAD7CP11_MYCRO|nr:hypothetical protein B0H17DRAFT_1213914 [Mycena rosella]
MAVSGRASFARGGNLRSAHPSSSSLLPSPRFPTSFSASPAKQYHELAALINDIVPRSPHLARLRPFPLYDGRGAFDRWRSRVGYKRAGGGLGMYHGYRPLASGAYLDADTEDMASAAVGSPPSLP